MTELTQERRRNTTMLKELNEINVEISKFKKLDQELKHELITSLIETDELRILKEIVEKENASLHMQINDLERESENLLRGEDIDAFCNRLGTSNQTNQAERLRDARTRLLGFGFSFKQIW